jgi:dihydrofolate synthase / folylpolyglutamate synthase
MTYPEAVQLLYSLGNEVMTAKLGLDRVTVLLKALGNPHRRGTFIHLAGTNGKGSTCAMIESVLRAAGVRTGLYTSPHLVEPTERIRICGNPVSPAMFATAFERVHNVAERLIRDGIFELHPTYFETVTAMGFLLFRDMKVQTTVLEVGLGGRLDATNVVQPQLSVITPIDFDHEKFLGKGLDAIAREKAGIFKPGVKAVISAQRPEVTGVLEETAAATGTELVWTSRWNVSDLALYPDGCSFTATGTQPIRVECRLPGAHQVTNALTAVAALDTLGFSPEVIREGIRQASWPGRLERISDNPEIYLDGAHNPAGARALAEYIRQFHSHRRVWIIYGAMRDKAVSEIAGVLFPLATELILTAPDQKRAVRAEAILEMADHPGARVAPRLADALEMVREAQPDDVIFITGSLFLVGEARKVLVK